MSGWALMVHGGAGAMEGRDYAPALRRLEEILREVGEALAGGVSCVDAVARAVVAMEDSGLYTAGRGSSPNSEGVVELDASIMEGKTQRAGGVCAVRAVKNPVLGAREVMEDGRHVLLAGGGAERFLRARGCAFVEAPEAYFQAAEPAVAGRTHGTVGAVALDQAGEIAAATSTGGIFRKQAGRVGDSPIPGAGVWADARVGVSSTGYGEYFLRAAAAYDVAARMEYGGASLEAAVGGFLREKLVPLGGDGGVIAIDASGRVAADFTGFGMKYGLIAAGREPQTGLRAPHFA